MNHLIPCIFGLIVLLFTKIATEIIADTNFMLNRKFLYVYTKEWNRILFEPLTLMIPINEIIYTVIFIFIPFMLTYKIIYYFFK